MAEKKERMKRGKGGAKGKYEAWIKPEGIILIKGWKMDGLTNEQVAHNIGITRETLNQWRHRFPDIDDALKMYAEVADRIVENALFEKAKSGHLGAICFFLKNRKPDVWRETKDTTLETEIKKLQADKLKEEIEKLKKANSDIETPMLNQVESVLIKIKKTAEEEVKEDGSDNNRTDTKAD